MSGHAAVIGAGITGVAAAEWLRRAGWRVTLIDRIAPGEAGQTSFGNAGLLARSSIVPVSVPGLIWKVPRMLTDRDGALFLRAAHLPRLLPWLIPFLRAGRAERVQEIAAALAGLTGDAVDQHLALAGGTQAGRYIRTGEYAFLYPDRAAFLKDGYGHALRRAHGFHCEERDAHALRAADPALGPMAGHAAVFPDHGWITAPGPYVAALAAHFATHGGEVRRAEVADIAPGRVTLAGGETLSPDRVVLSAGVWSRRLAERLGLRVPMESERGYHLMLKAPSTMPPFPYMLAAAKFVVTPMADGLRLAGLVEFGGLAAPPSRAPFALMRRAVRRLYPGLTWEGEEEWMGHRPSTTDSLPLLGEDPRTPGIVHAYGAQHVGLTVGPRLGRLAAALAMGERPNADLAPFSVTRFGR